LMNLFNFLPGQDFEVKLGIGYGFNLG